VRLFIFEAEVPFRAVISMLSAVRSGARQRNREK